MKIEKNGRAYWYNKFNKFFSLGTGIMLLGVLSFISKKDLVQLIIPLICGTPLVGYALYCKKKGKEAEERNSRGKDK